ncbi:hypothetical protein [Achromobacter sp. AGC39]
MQLNIKDNGGRLIGVAKVSTGTGAVMEGSFTPMPDFAPYAALFAAREEAQNAPGADSANPADSAPSSGMNDAADRLQRDIDGHGFVAQGPMPLPGTTAVQALRIAGARIRFTLPHPLTAKADG